MFNIIPLILILVSLSVIIIIVVRKFPVLANLDLETIQAEREAKFKERIISNRLKRSYFKYLSRLLKILKPLGLAIINLFKWVYKKLIEFKENYNRTESTDEVSEGRLDEMFAEVEVSIKEERMEKAEEGLLKIISLDSKNIRAFKELGKLYHERKDFNEARQTFEHALKLLEQESEEAVNNIEGQEADKLNSEIAEIYFNLSLTLRSMDNYEGAMKSINKALRCEPNNPRYLDTRLEISIISKDKVIARDTFEKLAQTNPDNQKLDDLKKQIEELS